jgi:hypothetical protein
MTSASTVRFEDSSSFPPLSLVSSNTAAKTALSTGLQALHPHLRENEAFTGLAGKILQLFFTLQTKAKSVKKFTNETYLPQSCRVNIKLTGSHRITKSEKFVALQAETEAEVKSFQLKMRDHFQKAYYLEISALRSELHERIITFTDLLVKHQLLTNNACRVHSKSKELTYKMFEKEPIESHNDDQNDDDDDENTPDSGKCHMKDLGLDYGCRNNKNMRTTLAIPLQMNIMLNAAEEEILGKTKKSLKQTLTAAFDAFNKKEEEKISAKTTKEILLQAITGEAADATAIALDDEDITIPNNMTDLKDMFNQLMVDFHKNNLESKVKGVRGAKKGKQGASLKNKSKQQESEKTKHQKKNRRKGKAHAKRKQPNSADDAAPDSAKGDKRTKKKNTLKNT